jgi:hypothetical protein
MSGIGVSLFDSGSANLLFLVGDDGTFIPEDPVLPHPAPVDQLSRATCFPSIVHQLATRSAAITVLIRLR